MNGRDFLCHNYYSVRFYVRQVNIFKYSKNTISSVLYIEVGYIKLITYIKPIYHP